MPIEGSNAYYRAYADRWYLDRANRDSYLERLAVGDIGVSGNFGLPNNKAIRIKDSGGTLRDVLLLNASDNLFIDCLSGKAIYLARSNDNSEVALFGAGSGSGGTKDFYIDSAPAIVGSQLVDSPNMYLRGALWDGSANVFLSFRPFLDVITAGAAAAREGRVQFKFGTFGSEVSFLELKMAAGPAYDIDVLYNLDIGAKHIKTAAGSLYESGGIFYFRNLADSGNDDLAVGICYVRSQLNFDSDAVAILARNVDGNHFTIQARDTGVGLVEIARAVGAAYPEFQLGASGNAARFSNAGYCGFFGTAPQAKPTGVAVTAAGIHAALVTLGLIAA